MSSGSAAREGDKAEIVFSVSRDEMRAFAALSGDRNPLHADDAFARAKGFAGPVVFGGIIVAKISSLLGNEIPGPGCVWHEIDVKFRAPLYVGEACRVTASVTYCNAEIGLLRMDVDVRAGDRRIANGKLQAGFSPS